MSCIRNRSVALAVALVAALSAANSSFAQEQYRLEQDGQWQQQTVADPETPDGQLQAIRKALAEEEAGKALKLAKKWIKKHPADPLLPAAHLLKGDALFAQKEYFKALFDYEMVIRAYPASKQFAIAIGREYEIARLFAGGLKRRWLGMRVLSASGEAEEIFIRIQERLPGSELGEKASLALGDLYFGRGEMSSATLAYDMFLENYPRSSHRERAMLRLIEASLATFAGPSFDPTGLLEAAQRIEQFQKEFPAAAERLGAAGLLVRIDELLASKQVELAQWYERRGERVSAIYLCQRVLKEHPGTAAAQVAERRLAALQSPAAGPPAAPQAQEAEDES